jgi:rhodanese-related sulfurtransferase/DNA-binding transcriptional ArsR family regulator
MTGPNANDALYDELARLASALASPTRLRALNLLLQEPKAIEELSEALGESPANTAAHMKALRAVGLVVPERRGKYVFQRPADEVVARLFLALRNAGETLSPVIRSINDAPDEAASAVSSDELEAVTQGRGVVLVDLRPTREFAAGHLPGARSFPLSKLLDDVRDLPAKRRVLAYCRGRYCANARRGVELLRAAGVRAERLRFGVPEWRAEGRMLVSGEDAKSRSKALATTGTTTKTSGDRS